MFKKSILIVLIQLCGSLLGLLTIYFIAGDMAPEVYSLTGVYTLISGVALTFSQLGIETVMEREALSWIEHKKNELVEEYSTQAIVNRLLMFVILFPVFLLYLLYLNAVKYHSQYTMLMFMMIIGSFFSAINNSMTQMVKANGEYVFSQIVSTINTYFVKFMGIALYFIFDENVYLYFYVLSSIPIAIIYGIKMKHLFKFKYINLKETLKKAWRARYLWLKSYLVYLGTNIDSVIISLLFPAGIMGAYTIFKNLELMIKRMIEGFFDVLSQNTVRFKGQVAKLEEQEKKIKLARNLIEILFVIGIVVYSINMSFWVNLANLSKYEYIEELLLVVLLLGLIHVWGKYEINAIAFFAPSKTVFMSSVILTVTSFLTYAWLFFMPNIYGMLAQKICYYVINSLLMIIIFNKNKQKYYCRMTII